MTGAYHVSKFALAALNHGLRLELAPWDIPVVLIEPGTTATRIWATGRATAERILAALPAETAQRYGPEIAAATRASEAAARHGAAPEQVASAIARALTARRPRTRQLVGTDAKVAALIARLPDRLRDRLVLSRVRG